LVDALSFTEAEARIIEEMQPLITGDFVVVDIKRAKISELFFNEAGDRFFKVKLNFITLDEKSGAEKKTAANMLVQATTLEEAKNVLVEGMKSTMCDYSIENIGETKLMDVFPFDVTKDSGESNCLKCELFSLDTCKNVYCTAKNRKDNNDVHFEKL